MLLHVLSDIQHLYYKARDRNAHALGPSETHAFDVSVMPNQLTHYYGISLILLTRD